MAKKRKRQAGRKQKKHNLTGLDFNSLVALRDQVDEAMSGYRSTLERQLAALGGSVAEFGGRVARGARRSLKGIKVAPKYQRLFRQHMGWPWCNATMVEGGNERRKEAGRFCD